MKKLKNLSLFKIVLFIAINILVNNVFLLIISIIYLLFDSKKQGILFIIIFSLVFIFNSINNDFIKYGIVESKQDKYVIVDKLIYKTKVYSADLNVGDLLYFIDNSSIDSSNYDQKHNVKYTYDSKYNVLYSFKIRKFINNRFESFDSKTKAYLNRILLNKYSDNDEIEDIGYGFSFYYLLILIKRKNKKLSYIFTLIYIILFGFDIKFYLIIADMITNFVDTDRLNKLSIKLLFILLINKYLIYNYSIIISKLLSLYYMSEFKKDKFYISIIQSLLFNQIQLFTLFFYIYLMYIRVFMFILSFITFLISSLSNAYILVIELISNVLNVINFGVRGKINTIVLLLLFLIFKLFNIKNQFIKILILLFVLISPINNPFKHVTFIDVGQGDSTLIKGELNKYNVLIDTGSIYNYSKLKKELFKQGIYNIDYLIITHEDSDHSGNVNNLLKDFNIKEIIVKGKDIKINNDYLKYLDLGKYDNDNDNSLVYLLNIDDYKILFTGDISSKVENKVLDYEVKDIDVLKVSHHGSKSASSNYFIGNINPKFAIISTSGAYNHPNSNVLDNLNAYYVKTYITKNDGSISFYYTGLIDFIKTDNNEFCYNLKDDIHTIWR